MTFEKFVLKRPCVSKHVSSSFMCSFWMKLIWKVLNMSNFIFGLKMYRTKTRRTNQGSLRKDPCWWPELPKEVQHIDGKGRLVAWSTPRRWCESSVT